MKSDSMRITYAPPQSGTYDGLSYMNSVLRPKQKPEPKHIGNTSPRPYAEVRASSSFSFLEAATLPEDLIGTAAEKDVSAMAIIDRNGVYGAPRFYTAAKKAGIKALVGSELIMDHGRITLLVESRTGYKNLCKLITAGAMKHPKGDARYTWELVEQYAEGPRPAGGARRKIRGGAAPPPPGKKNPAKKKPPPFKGGAPLGARGGSTPA